MPINLNKKVLEKATYLTGDADTAAMLPTVPAKQPFAEDIIEFLNDVSREIMKNRAAKIYSDVVTFGFWIRKASILKLKERYDTETKDIRMGRGVAFHIAPSNVPVNFAYSLVAGLVTGNANVVRVPSKDFPQVKILADAINKVLEERPEMKPYVLLVRYGRDQTVNDALSSAADTRIVWGGDQTIAELRKSPLPPRSGEVTFADRYSLAVIDSDSYLALENKEKTADDFYNDTFFTDQNACTSPRIIVWTGSRREEAKQLFWDTLHQLVEKKYTFQPIQGVNKLTSSYLIAAVKPGCKIEKRSDNLIVRVRVPEVSDQLMELKDNSGYFFEYDCDDILELRPLCDNKRCQTIGYIGDSDVLKPLIYSGVKGIDRIVPVGKTMDFDLIWDGYDLPALLTRTVSIS
ncbi:MAG: hypothetical protein MJ071_02445 [Oscillospiraceae bacterium]|nr:hypothetical protein [Oscillospiraceae bacterium]